MPDLRLEFSLDVLTGSACVRPNPPGSAPVVSQLVAQLGRGIIVRQLLRRYREG